MAMPNLQTGFRRKELWHTEPVMSRGIASLVLGLALAVPAAIASPGATDGRATVRIAQLSPLVVAGRGFEPSQRLAVTVRADSGTETRRTRATVRGTFRARFTQTSVDRCGGEVSVVVAAAGGVVAKVRRPPFYCPPGIP